MELSPDTGVAATSWRPQLPSLTVLRLKSWARLVVGLDGLPALEQLHALCPHGTILDAGRPLLQLTHLDLVQLPELVVPWAQLVSLRSLHLQNDHEFTANGEMGDAAELELSGSNQLRGLQSLQVDVTSHFQPPPGPWLSSVTHLVLERCLDNTTVGVCYKIMPARAHLMLMCANNTVLIGRGHARRATILAGLDT